MSGNSCTTQMGSVPELSWRRDVKLLSRKCALCHPCSDLPQIGGHRGIYLLRAWSIPALHCAYCGVTPSIRMELLPRTAGAKQQVLGPLSTSVKNKPNRSTAAHFAVSTGRNTDRQWKCIFVPSYNLEHFALSFFCYFHPVQYVIIQWHHRENQIHAITLLHW